MLIADGVLGPGFAAFGIVWNQYQDLGGGWFLLFSFTPAWGNDPILLIEITTLAGMVTKIKIPSVFLRPGEVH